MTLLLFACSDYNLKSEKDGTGTTTETTEILCELQVPRAGSAGQEPECEPYDAAKVDDPWDLSLEWQYNASTTVNTPVVGNLTDDNGDGVINGDDIPDVAMVDYGSWGSSTTLHIVSGDGSGAHCTADDYLYDGGVIIADVDGDGRNEVVGPTIDGRVKAVDGACQTKWISPQSYSMLYPITTAADLDGDGDVEVICDVAVVDGATGSAIATLTPTTTCWRSPIAADLDQDGLQEIILGDSVYAHDGTLLWQSTHLGTACFGAVANLDDDPEAEVVMSIGSKLVFYEHDGTEITVADGNADNPGPPCVGDIDGDGLAEVIAPTGDELLAFEHDGTPKWYAPMRDNSGGAGCSVFDMNGDSVYEVLFADEIALRVYQGGNGEVLYENTAHGSVTYFETPTIADVDNDGSAEMIVANSSGHYSGLTAFGHDGSGWPAAGPTWGLHDYAASNQNEDGSIPTRPEASWLTHNIFRGRPHADKPGTPNLVVQAPDVCAVDCDDPKSEVQVAFQVSNSGFVDAAATEVALYLIDGDIETFYQSKAIVGALAGEALAGGVFTLPLSDWRDGVLVRVDDNGSGFGLVNECLETDNEARWVGSVCE